MKTLRFFFIMEKMLKGECIVKKINWGVLGTAGIARGQTIPGMQQAENCCLYAVAGRSLEKARVFQKEFGFEKAYGSYDELLADPKVQAVYIPLPNELHYEWTVKAMQAGKHVLCEKPLAPTPEQVQQLYAKAEECGVFLMEAFAYLHSPYVAALKEELNSGIIGDVLYVESEFITSDYNISNIRMRKETFGGSVYDLGCYCTSMVLWLLGEEPEKVQAVAEFSDRGIDTLATAILTFPSGVRALLTSGMILATDKDYRIDRLQIHGTKGSIRSEVKFNQAGDLCYTVWTDAGQQVKTVYAPHNYGLEVAQLGRCILDGETIHVTKAFSISNSKVLQKILEKIGY